MKMVSVLFLAGLMLTSGPAMAGDPAAGKAKAATCAACHGPNGVPGNPLWPNLAGQKDQYLIKQMKAFRDGQRQDPLMARMSASLSDQDIEDLAAYFSSLNAGG